MKRIGLLGGSFNPAHGGHRAISLGAIKALGLDEVWWLVSPGNPLKPRKGMAPLAARFASAREQARGAPIKVTAIERQLGTRYTFDTLQALLRTYPNASFVWLMGADNLASFTKWRNWRGIARMVPIAVISRPGYDDAAMTGPAMNWLARYRVPAAEFRASTHWHAPTLIILRLPPDPRSATAIRESDPNWARRYSGNVQRDMVTRRPIVPEAEC